MQRLDIYSTRDLLPKSIGFYGHTLLLEGSRPDSYRQLNCFSLDESIDARWSWLDRAACRLSERLIEVYQQSLRATESSNAAIHPAFLLSLPMRYRLVKLLRMLAIFSWNGALETFFHYPDEKEVRFHAYQQRDEDYHNLLHQFCEQQQVPLTTIWHSLNESTPPNLLLKSPAKSPAKSKRKSHTQSVSRTLAGTCNRWFDSVSDVYANAIQKISRHFIAKKHPENSVFQNNLSSVVLCGNPHILNPVCKELIARKIPTYWLWEEFAFKSWTQWRPQGVRQLICRKDYANSERKLPEINCSEPVYWRGIDFSQTLNSWIQQSTTQSYSRWNQLQSSITEHFERIQPSAIVVDEDASPLQRLAIEIGRQHHATSAVIQHGAACVSFGFVPQLADQFFAWGETTKEQLVNWGIEPNRITITGSPKHDDVFKKLGTTPQRATISQQKRSARSITSDFRQILLLATKPPNDDRPDSVTFHLTEQTYQRMFENVFTAVSQLPLCKLVIKLHPRALVNPYLNRTIQKFPNIAYEVRTQGDLSELIIQSDVVISCASSAGIEATLLDVPVIQLLPEGSGEILPASDYGMLGSARSSQELFRCLEDVFGSTQQFSKSQQNHRPSLTSNRKENVFGNLYSSASKRVVDELISQVNQLTVPTIHSLPTLSDEHQVQRKAS